MAYRAKEKQVCFKVEDDVEKEIKQCADREDLTVADFARKVFKYGFFKYQGMGSQLWRLEQERREALLEHQTEINQQTVGKGKRTHRDGQDKKRVAG